MTMKGFSTTAIFLTILIRQSNSQLQSPLWPVCPDREIVYVCQQPTLNGNGILRWTITVNGMTNRLQQTYQTSSELRTSQYFDGDTFGFVASLVDNSPMLNSTLTVTANRTLNGTQVECEGLLPEDVFVQVINITTLPLMLDRVDVVNHIYGSDSVSVTLNWSSNSGTDYYTVVVLPQLESGDHMLTLNTASLSLTLMYNTLYFINITTSNCAGRSNSFTTSLIIDGCSEPIPPGNGSISSYSSREEGATLTFQCNSGYIPQTSITAICQNRNWTPDPAGFSCEDCGTPTSARGLFIQPYNTTTVGSEITFQCMDGLIPENEVTAVCRSDGEWSQDPEIHVCGTRNSVDCGHPETPVNGFVNEYSSTLENASITFQCNGNSSVMKAVCFGNGSWVPNPANLDCTSSDSLPGCSSPQLSYGGALTVTGVICSTVFFILGNVSGMLCLYLILRNKQSHANKNDQPAEAQPPLPVYEDIHVLPPSQGNIIELKENVAYGPIK